MTCNKKTKKNQILCRVVYNKLEISDVFQELKSLSKLEVATSVIAIQKYSYHGERSNQMSNL